MAEDFARMKFKFALIFFFSFLFSNTQESIWSKSFIDVSYFRGNIALHNNDILHLISGHPEGVVVGWNKRTFGEKSWQQRYNYPDYGVSFSYQDLKNENLGENYALYAHYNFYWLNRKLMLRIGQGLALTTNPYDKESNFRNIAFGSKLMSSTLAMLQFKQDRLFENFGIQLGATLIHYSNANVKAPNTSVNSITVSAGLNYHFDEKGAEYSYDLNDEKITERVKYNLVFRSGINESDVIGSGQFPFYIFSAYADKRLGTKSAIQLGSEVFFSNFLKELIKYNSVAFQEENIDSDLDYKRVGVFLGHELFINRLSVITQLGYYVYYPYDFEGRTYQRIGLKHYFNNKIFAAITLKSHAAKAEAVELGIGVRL